MLKHTIKCCNENRSSGSPWFHNRSQHRDVYKLVNTLVTQVENNVIIQLNAIVTMFFLGDEDQVHL